MLLDLLNQVELIADIVIFLLVCMVKTEWIQLPFSKILLKNYSVHRGLLRASV